ncbi:MAG: phosphatase PAP2 family protein [Bacteroidetes bacterium]|nr:phosphatase PAP2 family protein [Bacteroidota bacterium]
MKKYYSRLTTVDFVSIVFLSLLILLDLIFCRRVSAWAAITAVNLAVIIFILFLAYITDKKKTRLLTGIHRFYNYGIVFFVYKEIYLMVHAINPIDYDELFIAVDKWIFGVNPTQWIMQFANPVLTEILQIAYFSYYFLFIVLGVDLYCRRTIKDFDHGAFLIVYGFYLSYLGYFLLPAIGPRFTLHDFYAINEELPGLLFTSWIRDFLNMGESISSNMPNAAELVQRDVFPSGHTQLTLTVVYLSYKYKLQTRWIIAVLAGLLIIATIYHRYHYVADLLGGFAFFVFTIWSGKKIQDWWETKILN